MFTPITYAFVITTTIGGTTNPAPGNHTCSQGQNVSVQAIPDTNYTLDYWELDTTNIGKPNPLNLTIEANHTLKAIFRLSVSDIAVTKITLSKTIADQGYTTDINVTVANQGDYDETFSVTVSANTTSLGGPPKNITLTNGNSITLDFTWNTTDFAKGEYIINATAGNVPGETYTSESNNTLIGGPIILSIPGDIDGNFRVQLFDLVSLAKAYNSKPGEVNWNPNADIDNNGIVGLNDLVILASNYGQHYP